MRRLLPVELRVVERQTRLLAILSAAERVGFVPLDLGVLHMLSYLADVLAPVWNLPIIDPQILKQHRPFYPALQGDLDALVGIGVVTVEDVNYVVAGEDWHLVARYGLNQEFAAPILAVAAESSLTREVLEFVEEVVGAASGLDVAGIQNIKEVDATYANPIVAFGGLLELDGQREENATTRVARRFRTLLAEKRLLTDAEMIHLYVRHLYSRYEVA